MRAYAESYYIRAQPADIAFAINEVPLLNPSLPCALDAGESRSWLYLFETPLSIVRTARAMSQEAKTLVGEVYLGSGERLVSAELPVEYASSSSSRA